MIAADDMKAVVLHAANAPLSVERIAVPTPCDTDVLIRVRACAVCRTDLHIVDGELGKPKLPLVLGHEFVGVVRKCGRNVPTSLLGSRVGVPWLGHTCGVCAYCASGRENLCDDARFTGYDRDGGYAEWAVADARYCFPLPDSIDDVHAAPLLCAGLIGYRSLRATGDARRIGIFGFGAAAHIVAQIARFEGRDVFAFTRPGDVAAQRLARACGATWAGASTDMPPERLDAAILFAPVGDLVPLALGCVEKGGVVVCGGIHMSDIPRFGYELLWGERSIRSVANLTRADGHAFFAIAREIPLRTQVECFRLEDANIALERLRTGTLTGAAVLVCGDG